MGELLRCYWLPAALADELAPGGAIRRLKLLGEALVMARDPDGALTVMADGCLYSARRARGDGTDYHRVHPFLMPFHTMIGGAVDGGPTAFNGKC